MMKNQIIKKLKKIFKEQTPQARTARVVLIVLAVFALLLLLRLIRAAIALFIAAVLASFVYVALGRRFPKLQQTRVYLLITLVIFALELLLVH